MPRTAALLSVHVGVGLVDKVAYVGEPHEVAFLLPAEEPHGDSSIAGVGITNCSYWFNAHYYADGEGVLTASATPESGRTLLASGRICAEAKYVRLGFTPSNGISGSQCFHSCSTSLVGGNGTVWASSKTAYTYFRIDTANTPGVNRCRLGVL